MALSIKQHKQKSGTRRLNVKFEYAADEETGAVPEPDYAYVRYSPSAYTEEFVELLTDLQSVVAAGEDASEEDRMSATSIASTIIVALVTEWEILGEDGKPVPITREAVRRLSLTISSTVASAIIEDQNPGND